MKHPIKSKDVELLLKEYYDKDEFLWQDLSGELAQRLLASLIPILEKAGRKAGRNRIAVDVGSGGGRYTQLLTEYYERICGVDFAHHLCIAGRTKFKGKINFLNASSTSLPFQDDSVDLILAVGLTECLDVSMLEEFVREMHRCLSPGGSYIIRFWNPVSAHGLLRLIGKGISGYPEFFSYSPCRVKRILSSCGFSSPFNFCGALLLARWWWGRFWISPFRRLLLLLEEIFRRFYCYDTYFIFGRK